MPPTKSGQKLLIIGLDGATFDLALPMIEKGEMPNLGQLLAQGTAANLLSTVPPVTGPAWSSFMTGKDPGGHGVYHFRAIDPTQYDQANETLVTSRSFQGPTFWDILGEVGHRVAVVTVPVTYPPWPINGVMISGYPCPDTRNNHTYPPEFADQLPDPLNFDATFYSTATPEAVAEGSP